MAEDSLSNDGLVCLSDDDLVRINDMVAPHGLRAELLPARRVGVTGDNRAYFQAIVLIGSPSFPPHEVLAVLSTDITNRFRVGSVTIQLAVADAQKNSP